MAVSCHLTCPQELAEPPSWDGPGWRGPGLADRVVGALKATQVWVPVTVRAAIRKEGADLRAPHTGFLLSVEGPHPRAAPGGWEAVSLATLCFWVLLSCLALALVGRLHLRELLSTCGMGTPACVFRRAGQGHENSVFSTDQAALCTWLLEASRGRVASVPFGLVRAGAEPMGVCPRGQVEAWMSSKPVPKARRGAIQPPR